MRKLIFILLLGACAMVQAQSTYYVATDGDNGNNGSIGSPWATLIYALTQISGSNTVYIRGGTYMATGSHNIGTDLNGTPSAYTVIAGYPGERPIFDYSNYTAGAYDQVFFFDMGTQFVRLENITAINLAQNETLGYGELGGVNSLYCANLHFENLRMENIGGRGYMHWSYLQSYGITYDTTFYINCDAVNCNDILPSSQGGDPGNFGDGFKCYSEAAAGVYGYVMIYRGCRAINCGDDGFDIGSQTGLLIIDQCWAIENGLNGTGYDGNGYKINGSLYVSNGINKVITRSIAANNNFTGFRMQESEGYERSDARLYNNFSFYNIGNGGGIGGGFGNDDNVDDVVIQNEWRNNIAYYNYSDPELTLQREFHFDVYQSSPPTGSNNSFNIVSGYPGWEWNIQADSSDFVSLDIDELKASRQEDGSLPSVNFGVLVEGSDFVDAGTTSVTDINSLPYVIPISYNGSAPDIGYAEYGTAQLDSTANDILSFSLASQTGSATISTVNHTVAIEVEYGTDVTDLSPTITVSPNATIAPLSGASQNFTNSVNYTVTSLDETDQIWVVTVTVAAAPEEPVDYSGYRFTGQRDRLGRAVYTRVDTSSEQILIDIPDPADALFSLTSISGDNMIDAVNGWEFPINGKDWEDDEWDTTLVSLPWKTEATISPPADGTDAATAIQAVDSDNFWYQSDGTANAIPVQAFFQNINYSNLYFCRHIERTVDTIGYELYPPSVADITLYKTARTITSTYTDYFGSAVALPVAATDIFVSKDGNDSTGDGTFAAPYLTIAKAETELTSHDNVIYVLSGIYDENSGSDYLDFAAARNYNNTLQGCGNVVITSPSTDHVFSQKGVRTITVNNIQFDGETNTTRVFGLYTSGTSGSKTILNKCLMIGATTEIHDRSSSFYGTFELFDCVCNEYKDFEIYIADPDDGIVSVYGSLINRISITNAMDIKYCKVNTTDALHIEDCKDGSISFCRFEGAGSYVQTSQITSRTAADYTLTISNNLVKHSYNTVSVAAKLLSGRHADVNYVVEYNKMLSEDENAVAYTFQATDYRYYGESIIERYNYLSNGSTGIQNGFNIYSPPAGFTAVYECYNNYIISNQDAGTMISTSESPIQELLDGSKIYNNYIRGALYNNPESDGGEHAILLTCGKNMHIYNNRVEWCNLGIVYKSNNNVNTEGGIYSNYCYNNKVDIYIRRTPGLNVVQNTIIKDSGIGSGQRRQFIKMDYQYQSGVDMLTQDIKIKNNIITYNAPIGASYTPVYAEDSSLVGLEIDNNVIHGIDTANFIFNEDGDIVISQDDAITAGYVENNSNSDPSIISIPNSPYPATTIETGIDLGTGYDDGLDTLTNWASFITSHNLILPAIVTRQQNSNWQLGAYVQEVEEEESNPYAVIADHTVVDLYDDIPSNWIDSVKNMMVNVGGMSHGYGYFNGAYILEQMDSTYAVEFWIMDETPPTTSSGELRLGRPYMFGTTSWTSQTGIDGLNSINEGFANSGAVFDVWQIVFSYDFTWNNDPGGDVDPVYDVRWAGDSEGGIDGSRIFGLDNGDTALTSNRVTLLNYFDAVNQWNDYAQAQGFNTLSIFSTGAVDGNAGGTENGFQRELKNQFIRDYIDTVQHQVYFFDYADILTHNAAGELYQATWDDDGTPRPHDQIHPDNQEDYAEYADFGEEDHVGEVGAVRVAKAYWWLLARIAGWDGEP